MFSADDHRYMARALQLARLGMTSTAPNPRVGCVVVSDGQVAGEGWHVRAGTPHAERHALAMAGERARGATAYVTLEPCSHFGRTPPCADALLQAGVGRVVAAMVDPNPLVAGQGMTRLAAAGIECASGLLEAEARELNRGFVSRMTRGRPWLTVKLGISLDGKTALADGQSQWITGAQARADVMRQRACHDVILTGSGTVRADNPQLTVRNLVPDVLPPALQDTPAGRLQAASPVRQPLRVIVDGAGTLDPDAAIFCGAPVRMYTAATTPATGRLHGHTVVSLPGADGRVDLAALLADLGRLGVNDVWCEAGMGLAGALLHAGLVDELVCYMAPVVLGHSARGMFDLPPLAALADKSCWRWHDVRLVGNDLRLTLRPGSQAGD